eukprot:3332326-Prymnesium_polylepis.2
MAQRRGHRGRREECHASGRHACTQCAQHAALTWVRVGIGIIFITGKLEAIDDLIGRRERRRRTLRL